MVEEHRGQAGGFALNAAGTAHWCQKLQIFDVALSPGCTPADILCDCLLDTKQGILIKIVT